MKIGLAMTGGGARGAYQGGVLKRIGEIRPYKGRHGPFQIIGAASAGSVNAAALAAGAEDFHQCTQSLARLWANIRTEDIYRSDLKSLVPMASKLIRDLSFGSLYGGGRALSFLDASPLKTTLTKLVRFELIQKNISEGKLEALCIAATNYSSGKTFLFIQRTAKTDLWIKTRRIALDTQINVDHICASAAIPVVFQPVKVKTSYGTHYFGDGCLRMVTPLSPVIRLGADRILSIGVRQKSTSEERIERPVSMMQSVDSEITPPPLAQVLGVTLNAIFLDHLDSDVEHLERLNEILKQANLAKADLTTVKEPMKIISPLSISPSHDLGNMAESFSKKLPAALRYLMGGLGTSKTSSSDLISYLLFDSGYTRALVELGYKDAAVRIDEIEDFLFSEKNET